MIPIYDSAGQICQTTDLDFEIQCRKEMAYLLMRDADLRDDVSNAERSALHSEACQMIWVNDALD